MPILIAPGCVRYTVNGTYAGRPVANILDFFVETTGSIVSREDALFAMAGIVINEWSDHIVAEVSNDYTFTSVSWVDLDSDDGSTGSRTSTDQVTLPEAGAQASGSFPGNVAVRVIKNTTSRRGQRQGRMYVVGFGEELTSADEPNRITGPNVTTLNEVMESLLGDLNQSDEGPAGYESALVVIHTVDDVYESRSSVTSLSVDPLLGSQRRRLRG